MIHQVYLPETMRKRLEDVVALQMLLLAYAASRDTLKKQTAQHISIGVRDFADVALKSPREFGMLPADTSR